MPIIVLQKPIPVKYFCITFIFIFVCCQQEARAAASKSEGQREQATANQNISPTQTQTPLVQANIEQPETVPAERESKRKQEEAASGIDKPMTRAEKFALVLSILTLFIIAFQAVIYWKQLKVMRELKAVSDRQAGTFDSQATAMQESLAETRNIVSQNERAVKVAERNIEIIQESTIYAQRAYVSVTRGEVMGDMFLLVIENTGHTPANYAEILAVAAISEHPPDPETSYAKWTSMGVIAPDEYIKRMVVRRGEAIPEMRELVNDGKLKFFCTGIIRYKDIFKNTRQTKFCFYQRFGSNQFGPCGSGNEAD
jgi:hypothetical protein